MNKKNKSRKTNAIAKQKEGISLPEDYAVFIKELKLLIRKERTKALLTANSALVLMYWDIGKSILERQEKSGWGAKVIDRMSKDLKEEFPDMSGFSPRNLKYMRRFAEEWPNKEFVQASLAQIPWRSNIALMDKLSEAEIRLWYANQAIRNGWSRNVLVIQIELKLHRRIGQTTNNFDVALPPTDSDMANQMVELKSGEFEPGWLHQPHWRSGMGKTDYRFSSGRFKTKPADGGRD